MNNFVRMIVEALQHDVVPPELSGWSKAVGKSAMRAAAARFIDALKGAEEHVGASSIAHNAVVWIFANPVDGLDLFRFVNNTITVRKDGHDRDGALLYVKENYRPPVRR